MDKKRAFYQSLIWSYIGFIVGAVIVLAIIR